MVALVGLWMASSDGTEQNENAGEQKSGRHGNTIDK